MVRGYLEKDYLLIFDDLVKSSRCKALKIQCRGGSRTALAGAPQRFTLLDLLRREFLFASKTFFPLPGGRDPYLTGQGCSATPQMDFLRNHQYFISP
jgi:hypothetical protein